MGFFGFGKKRDVLDLSEKYRRQQEEKIINESRTRPIAEKSSSNSGMLGMLTSNISQNQSSTIQNSQNEPEESPEEKRKKFMQKFSEMSERLETISTSLYHLSQRVELLEKKILHS